MTASSARHPDKVILHWLGDMFDPALKGYWGSEAISSRRWKRCWPSSRAIADKVEGIKISLLDAAKEVDVAPPPAGGRA